MDPITPAPAPVATKPTRLQRFENFLKEAALFIPEHVPTIISDIRAVLAAAEKSTVAAAELAATDTAALVTDANAAAGKIATEAAGVLATGIDAVQTIAKSNEP